MLQKTLFSFCCACVLFTAQSRAQTGLSFLKLGPAAREQAMGDIGVASAVGAAANYYNPATLGDAKTSAVLFSQSLWLLDTYSSHVSGVFKSEQSAFGVSLTWLSVNDVPIRSRATEEPDGTFSSQNAAVSLSYARTISPALTLALTGKILYEKIYLNSATGFAADFSAFAKPIGESLTLGVALQNLGGIGTLVETASRLPTTLRAGGAYRLILPTVESSLALEANVVSVFSDKTHFAVGAEFGFREFLWGRLGYTAGNDTRSISGGVGVKVNQFKFDYAFVPFSNSLGSANVLTLQFLY